MGVWCLFVCCWRSCFCLETQLGTVKKVGGLDSLFSAEPTVTEKTLPAFVVQKKEKGRPAKLNVRHSDFDADSGLPAHLFFNACCVLSQNSKHQPGKCILYEASKTRTSPRTRLGILYNCSAAFIEHLVLSTCAISVVCSQPDLISS